MQALLPVCLWTGGAIVAVLVVVVAVLTSDPHAKDRLHPVVRPLPWSVVYLHFGSLALMLVAFLMLMLGRGGFTDGWRAFYDAALWPAVVLTFALTLGQVALMVRRSRRATLTEMDDTLRAAGAR